MQAPRVILVKICNEDSTILGMLNPHLQQVQHISNQLVTRISNPNFQIQIYVSNVFLDLPACNASAGMKRASSVSYLSLLIYIFPTPPINLKLGQTT